MKKLKAFGYAVSDLNETDIQTMFELFSKYYSNTHSEQFRKDLNQKDHVFVLKDKDTLEIKGFSTIVALNTEQKGKAIRGFFSGDTVIDKEYWGQGTLGVSFLKFLFIEKLKQPFTPLYWFLISKGYKTYLLMANNFGTHYPRFEQNTPADMQAIIDAFGTALYPKHYDTQAGVIAFHNEDKDAVKEEVSPISEELMENPRVHFFTSKNPNWSQGDELACIAKMTLGMPFYYQYKIIKKRLSKMLSPKTKRSTRIRINERPPTTRTE